MGKKGSLTSLESNKNDKRCTENGTRKKKRRESDH